jgi:hypothetical protein
MGLLRPGQARNAGFGHRPKRGDTCLAVFWTYLGLKVTVNESNCNSALTYASRSHDDEVVGAGSASVVVLCSAVRAEVVVVWVLMPALGTLRHVDSWKCELRRKEIGAV